MSGLFGAKVSAPPPPPPPPAPSPNPPTYASAGSKAPSMTVNPFLSGIGNSILTSPQGVTPSGQVGLKTLLGQ